MAADKYLTFEQLQVGETEGAWRTVVIARGVDIAVIAPHGGSIEPGTSEIAQAIAGEELNLYLFEGLKATGNRDLHITSTNFDEPDGLALVVSVQTVIALHGESSENVAVVFLGGRDTELGKAIGAQLVAAGFEVRAHERSSLQGAHPSNICNRGLSGRGVQLELSKGLRAQLFASLSAEGRTQPTARFETLIAAVRRALGLSVSPG